jgi:hypothetical protein
MFEKEARRKPLLTRLVIPTFGLVFAIVAVEKDQPLLAAFCLIIVGVAVVEPYVEARKIAPNSGQGTSS